MQIRGHSSPFSFPNVIAIKAIVVTAGGDLEDKPALGLAKRVDGV
jgi:hypothetical protein